jgi:hypothetical protein
LLARFLPLLRMRGFAAARTLDGRLAVQDTGDLLGDAIRRHSQGFVDMDVALSDASGGVP